MIKSSSKTSSNVLSRIVKKKDASPRKLREMDENVSHEGLVLSDRWSFTVGHSCHVAPSFSPLTESVPKPSAWKDYVLYTTLISSLKLCLLFGLL